MESDALLKGSREHSIVVQQLMGFAVVWSSAVISATDKSGNGDLTGAFYTLTRDVAMLATDRIVQVPSGAKGHTRRAGEGVGVKEEPVLAIITLKCVKVSQEPLSRVHADGGKVDGTEVAGRGHVVVDNVGV
ncbi:uncharacterized protein PG986_005172 [Apiospora aurea]|uniref:Uncharacterized protein n=1 Tax=Apiospora aurea TaxID=335848 RepID=A0ABR1QGU1_9PEZI